MCLLAKRMANDLACIVKRHSVFARSLIADTCASAIKRIPAKLKTSRTPMMWMLMVIASRQTTVENWCWWSMPAIRLTVENWSWCAPSDRASPGAELSAASSTLGKTPAKDAESAKPETFLPTLTRLWACTQTGTHEECFWYSLCRSSFLSDVSQISPFPSYRNSQWELEPLEICSST